MRSQTSPPRVILPVGAAAFIVSAASHLPSSDVWCILYPSLRHFLRSDVREITEMSLLMNLKVPVSLFAFALSAVYTRELIGVFDAVQLSRQVFDAAVQWAMKADRTPFWRSHRRVAKPESPQDSVATMRRIGSPTVPRGQSDE